MVVNGSLSKTAVNGSAGAKSQVSGLVVAVLTVVTLLFLTGLFESLPEATLAAVVIAALVELVDVPALRDLYRIRTSVLGAVAARPDFVAAIAAMLGVLVFDTLPGLFIGIGVSLLLLLYRASRPHVAVLGKAPGTASQWTDVARHADNQATPGVVVLRPEAGLFFANADWVRDEVRRSATQGVHAVVLDAETMPYLDVTAVRMLAELADDLERDGVQLVVARDIGQVRDVIRRAGEETVLSVYPTVQAAVDAVSRTGGPKND
jgi:anti-anti-sigma factor